MAVSSLRSGCWLAVAPIVATLLSATPGVAGDPVPSYLAKSRVPDLVAARAAIDTASSTALLEEAEEKRQADARLMSASDELARRAEQERVLAAEIRAKAEALSQRFAEELSTEHKVADLKQKPGKDGGKDKAGSTMAFGAGLSGRVASADAAQPAAAVSGGAHDDKTAQAMQRAADTLARARTTLDEADRRVAASKNGPAGTREAVAAEFADARRKAAEAVQSAEQALASLQPGTTDITTGSLADSKEAAKTADRRKSLPAPYALGGTLR